MVANANGTKPALLVVKPNADARAGKRQLVVSLYPKDEGWDWVTRQISDGKLIYSDPSAGATDKVQGAVADAQKKFAQTGRKLMGLLPKRGAELLGDG